MSQTLDVTSSGFLYTTDPCLYMTHTPAYKGVEKDCYFYYLTTPTKVFVSILLKQLGCAEQLFDSPHIILARGLLIVRFKVNVSAHRW